MLLEDIFATTQLLCLLRVESTSYVIVSVTLNLQNYANLQVCLKAISARLT